MVLVLGENERADFLVAGARHDARREFDHGNLDAQLGCRRRYLEPDQSGADHDQLLAGREIGLERARMRLGAQIVHARHARRQQRQLAHQRAARDHQGIVGQAAARRDDFARGAVDRRAACVEFHGDVVRGKTALARDQRVFGLGFAEQYRLRQRRLLVGLAALVGQQRNVGRRVLPLRRHGREHRSRSAADDQDVALSRRSSFLRNAGPH